MVLNNFSSLAVVEVFGAALELVCKAGDMLE